MIRYLIYGAGVTGRSALSLLGYGRTDFFIDSYKMGQECCGKQIISFERLIEINSQEYAIVVASEKYANEIIHKLSEVNINNYFVYHEIDIWILREKSPKYYLYRQEEIVSFGKILANNNIESYKKIAVLGCNYLLPYLICEIARQNNLNNILGVINISDDDYCSLGVKNVQYEEIKDDCDCLVINCKKNEIPITYCAEIDNNYKVVSLYDVDQYEPKFYHPELEKYKDIHKGKRIWIIGNGPSLCAEDLDVLYRHHEICFGFNKIYKIYNSTKWRADYVGITDARIMENLTSVAEAVNVPIFVGDEYHRSTDVKLEGVNYFHMNYEEYYPNLPQFSYDICKQVYWGCTVAYDIGIQFARYMGATEIYLLGMDNTNIGMLTDGCNHFCADYYSEEEKKIYENVSTEWDVINKAYEKAEKISRDNGFRIYNATRGGMLEVFERREFDCIFNSEMGSIS